MPSLQSKHDMVFFEEFRKRWSDYQLLIKSLSHLFGALENNYIPTRELKTLQEIGRQIFFEKVYDQMKDKTSYVIIEMIHREHEGGWIDGYLVRNEIDFFVSISNRDLKTYINDFEAQFLASTTTYYAQKAADNISIRTLLDYMIMVEECLERERKIAVQYFPSITEPKLLEIVGEQLLLLHSEQLFEKDPGFHILLADGRVEDLSRMYALFSKINKGLASMSEKFKKCVINDGMRLIKQAEDAASQKKALCGAFEVICNMTAVDNSIPNIVCSFIENIFKGGDSDDLSEPTIEETFDKIVRFLSCVRDKYLFSEIYRKNLARRLLNDRNACGDHERSLLVKIKQQLGMQLTSKIEGMINDMKLARDKQIEFQNYLDAHPGEHPGVDLTVTVLTTGFWPTYKISDLEIPEEMSSSVEIFNRFYMSGTRNRKLIWLFNLSTSVVIGKFDARSIEMSLTTYQIPMPSFGKKNVTEDVEKDRRYAIDAALPDVKAIKKRIEDLIARDFLERDANDLNIFKYVA
ncbi:Cullin-1 [Acorus calamus]|uniref:Cullin-1 n=1 Tax=Acorus calamus TaxID=4465 RepID=A0AAV9CFT9_ACOCL|nr:Cullin-1 [Acorus calamus]